MLFCVAFPVGLQRIAMALCFFQCAALATHVFFLVYTICFFYLPVVKQVITKSVSKIPKIGEYLALWLHRCSAPPTPRIVPCYSDTRFSWFCSEISAFFPYILLFSFPSCKIETLNPSGGTS